MGQSSADHTISGGTTPSASETVESGSQVAAIVFVPSSEPGKMQRPSPGPLSRPQTKHELYCSFARFATQRLAAATASMAPGLRKKSGVKTSIVVPGAFKGHSNGQ